MVGVSLTMAFFIVLRKISPFGVLAVLKERFFFTGATEDCRNTLCLSKDSGVAVGEKIPSKPCKSLSESALRAVFHFVEKVVINKLAD